MELVGMTMFLENIIGLNFALQSVVIAVPLPSIIFPLQFTIPAMTQRQTKPTKSVLLYLHDAISCQMAKRQDRQNLKLEQRLFFFRFHRPVVSAKSQACIWSFMD